jgi:hypothetical protein
MQPATVTVITSAAGNLRDINLSEARVSTGNLLL